MDNKQILKADLLDLIFDRRNKDYGAYELRKHYNRRISKALLITATLIGITLTSIAVAGKWKPENNAAQEKTIITLKTIEELPLPETPPEPLPPQKEIEPTRTEAYLPPRIVDDRNVEEPMATVTDLDSAVISNIKQEGPVDIGIVQNIESTIGQGKGIIVDAPKNDEPISIVEIQAKFDGNWEKFLTQNLNGDVPVNNNAAPGRYQVMIQFVVDVDGTVSDIKPLTNVGYGMEQEAVRVLRKAKKWTPAIQAGRQVKAYRKQPITFLVNEE